MDKFLLATDGSNSSLEAMREATQFLDAWPESKLIVTYVIAPMNIPLEPGGFIPDMKSYEDEEVAAAKAMFDSVFGGQSRVSFSSSRGFPAQAICELAERENVDLIIVGSHGKKTVQRALLGSVSEAVVRHASVPVLVVRRPHPASAV